MTNSNYWEREYQLKLDTFYIKKIDALLSIIPKDVQSIIDLGCGNGIITNELGKKYDVIGVDRSKEGLSSVTTKTIEASSDNVPLPDASCDLIISSEVLEHLDDEVYEGTIREMKRLSRKYIFISVPNEENIKKHLVQCIHCQHIFNKTYHLRSLNKNMLLKSFSEYREIYFSLFGNKKRQYHPVLNNIKHNFSPPSSWIPNHWTPNGYRKTLCPNCLKEFEFDYSFHPVSFVMDSLNMVFSPKKPYQLLLLLEKK